MRRFSFVCALSLSAIALLSGALPCRATVTLIQNGQALSKIYCPTLPVATPTVGEATGQSKRPMPIDLSQSGYHAIPGETDEPPLVTAVRELNYHLQKMTGATLPTVNTNDSAQVTGAAIVLGQLAIKLGARPTKNTPSREGFRIVVQGKRVLIAGESDEGTLFGVYAFLEKLGCDWVQPGAIGEIIPQRSTVQIADLDEAQQPDFQFRNLGYSGGLAANTPEDYATFAQWLRRQRCGHYWPAPAQTGGHTWDRFIKLHQKEFDADPTMLALRRMPDGSLQRKGPQLEATNPRVVDLFVQDIRAAFARNGWPKDKSVGFPIGPADGLGFSQSPEAMAAGVQRIDAMLGDTDQTDLVVHLGNEIQKRVENEYPNVWLGFYLYSVHSDYPLRYQPHPRLAITLAPISYSRFHSLLDENSASQSYYRNVVEQWGQLSQKQGNTLIYRGYNYNLAENMVPFTKLKIWGEELPFYKKIGVIGLNVEANKSWAIYGPHDYLFMRMAWNASQDWHQVLSTYCHHAFGAGAAPMERYFLRLVSTQHGAGQEAGSYNAIHLIYNDDYVAAAQHDIQEALQLATSTDDKKRIGFIGEGVESLRLYLAYHQATMNFDFLTAKTDYDAMVEHTNRVHAIQSDLVTDYAVRYLKRFLGQFVQEALKYSSGDYHLVERLPDTLPARLDPTNSGNRQNFFSPALNDKDYFQTKTYSTTWNAQGLSGTAGTSIWYRQHFQLPVTLKGQPIGLFIGGVDDQVRVWLNGKPIGSAGPNFSKPFQFDLTDAVLYKGDNVLAIQVARSIGANELGTGGLLLPSFLFTGPRLPTAVPPPAETRRVLPGGELGEVEK